MGAMAFSTTTFALLFPAEVLDHLVVTRVRKRTWEDTATPSATSSPVSVHQSGREDDDIGDTWRQPKWASNMTITEELFALLFFEIKELFRVFPKLKRVFIDFVM